MRKKKKKKNDFVSTSSYLVSKIRKREMVYDERKRSCCYNELNIRANSFYRQDQNSVKYNL